MAKQYDLAVIGTGTAATVAAQRVRDAGWRVAIMDWRPFGGTCALRGCDPKKVLVEATVPVDHARRMRDKGVAGALHIDWRQLMAFKREFTDPVPEKKEHLYADKGIDAYHGRARFTGEKTLDVEGEAIEAKHFLIASGAEPVRLGIPGEEYLVTSEGFMRLDELPQRIILVGGGYIAAEFSHIAARAGAHVTILQRGRRMLNHFDPEVVGWLMASFKAIDVDVRIEASVEAIEKHDDVYRVRASMADKSVEYFEADMVVHAAGRRPMFEPLDLSAAGIAMEKGRLQLNEYLQSVSNPAVYAAGDAAQAGPPLTPVAAHDARTVAANLLDGNHQKPDYRGVPSVAFTIPPIASVGLSEAQAREKGIKFRLNSRNASDWFTARLVAQPVYGFKILIDEESGGVRGAHLVGPYADEVINLFAMAIRHELTAEQLKSTIFAYPTGASDISDML